MTGHFRRPLPRPSLRRPLLLAALPLLLFVVARAQQPEPLHPEPHPPSSSEPKIAVTVKTVNVLAVVRDKHGKIVPDLPVESFVLSEDGRPQSINYFAHESDLPLRLGLLVDTSLSQRRVLEQERSASYAFVNTLLREKQDLAFVVNFDREVQLLQDFTDSRPKLRAAFEQLSVPEFQSRNSGYGRGRGGNGGGGGTSDPNDSHSGPPRGGGTHLYDAVYLASDELMRKQQGRKALIILSDGVDHGSKETLADAVEAAQRADTVVYSILFKDEEGYVRGSHVGFGGPIGVPMGGPGGGHGGPSHGGHPPDSAVDGKKVLAELSRQSGGRLFQVSKKETLEKIYAEIEEELRNQYRFGYTPDNGAEPGFHHISLTTHNKDLSVQTRDGYYGGP